MNILHVLKDTWKHQEKIQNFIAVDIPYKMQSSVNKSSVKSTPEIKINIAIKGLS